MKKAAGVPKAHPAARRTTKEKGREGTTVQDLGVVYAAFPPPSASNSTSAEPGLSKLILVLRELLETLLATTPLAPGRFRIGDTGL